jgi:hypothetical protein
VERQKLWPQWQEPQFIPFASTWLEEERWRDEGPTPARGPPETKEDVDARVFRERQERQRLQAVARRSGEPVQPRRMLAAEKADEECNAQQGVTEAEP